VLFGDGLNARDFIYVHDVTDLMHRLALNKAGPPVLKVGSGRVVTLRELVDVAAEVTGQAIDIELQPDRGFDVRRIVLHIRAQQATLPLEPIGLQDGIARTWRALQP
jgi:UDP-glucose 4-epimerase